MNAKDTVNLSGTSPNGVLTGLSAEVYPGATGAGGNITVKTRRLIARDGAVVSTLIAGQGQGGKLSVSASDSVELSGTSPNGQSPSGLLATAEKGSTGAAGDLTIATGKLIVRDGAQVSAGTVGHWSLD